jgi:hypothetical protein
MPTSIFSHQLTQLLDKCVQRGLLGKLAASCRALVAEHDALKDACKKGRTAKKPASAKAKGREGVVAARDWLLRVFGSLEADDILIQTTSVGGSDLHYSPKAARLFPFAPESKKVQNLNVWGALHQAGVNATKKGLKPVLFFSRNNGPLYIAFKADDLHWWLDRTVAGLTVADLVSEFVPKEPDEPRSGDQVPPKAD